MRGPGTKDFPFRDDISPVGDAQGFADVVVCDQDADAARFQIEDDLLKFEHGDGVDAAERLVEQNEVRLDAERSRDLDAASFATRQSVAARSADVRQIELLDQPFGAGAALAGVQFRVAGRGGLFTPSELEAVIMEPDFHSPRQRLVACEQPHNRAGGRLFGIEELRARRYLMSDEGRQEVVASDVYARRLGINGVPCFIVNRKYAVSGAQPPSAFVEVFNLAERDAATSAAQSTA